VSAVLDASLTIAWFFEDERSTQTEALLDRTAIEGAIVPSHWKIEVANGFQTAIRRKRIDHSYRKQAIEQLAALPIETDSETALHVWAAALELADQHELTVYNAVYLELAIRRHLPLASLDRDLLEAGRRAGLPSL
jgi:predicted nucleic acid-binding protein